MKLLTYSEMENIQKGTRLRLSDGFQWVNGTVTGTGTSGGDPIIWFKKDGQTVSTAIRTGLQFVEKYWDKQFYLLEEQGELLEGVSP